jgi:hypothetical protein
MPNVPPFVFFAIVLVVIWLLSAVANAMSKQKDAQRRQQVRQGVQRARTPQPGAYRPKPPTQAQQRQQLNAGYAVRHPEMLAPPPPPPVPMATRARVPVPPPPRRPQQRQTRTSRPTQAFMPPPPIPVLEADAPRPSAAAKSSPAGTKPQAPQTATAPAISRWLKPNTLRQQFILTEIFQPPLAMRQERFG